MLSQKGMCSILFSFVPVSWSVCLEVLSILSIAFLAVYLKLGGLLNVFGRGCCFFWFCLNADQRSGNMLWSVVLWLSLLCVWCWLFFEVFYGFFSDFKVCNFYFYSFSDFEDGVFFFLFYYPVVFN